MNSVLDNALQATSLLLCSVRAHARERWKEILARKSRDIVALKHTIWVLNSNSARPNAIQAFCREHQSHEVLFISREGGFTSQTGTSRNVKALSYSVDQMEWTPMAPELGPVTGDIKRSTSGLWLEALVEISSGSLDLSSFEKTDGTRLDRFWPSDSAYLVKRAHPLKDGKYKILAAGRLAKNPCAVWLRS